MQLILVRHGETELNTKEVYRGRIDVALNETGMKQAALLGEALKDMELEAVYSSPMKRALSTAEAVARPHGLAVQTTFGLMDLDFGYWQGVPRAVVREKYPEEFIAWRDRPSTARIPGGEGLSDVRERVMGLVEELGQKHKGNVALVSHRVVHNVLICSLLGLDNTHFWNINFDNCATSTFVYRRGQYILAEHNNTSHLKPLLKSRTSEV